MCHNQSTIKLFKNLVFHNKTKHFEVGWHFIQKKVEEKIVLVHVMNTTKQPANMLTKALGQIKFEACKSKLNLKNVKSENYIMI
jgi:predicted peroxiredoxin